MKKFTHRIKRPLFFLTALVLIGVLSFSHFTFAFGISRPFGGKVITIGPAYQVDEDQAECDAMQFTVGEETQTAVWIGLTDEGYSQTFNLEPDDSPEPHPDAYIVYSTTEPSSPNGAEEGTNVLGNYTYSYTELGECQITDTTTYPPVVITYTIPYYLDVGEVTLYGASAPSLSL